MRKTKWIAGMALSLAMVMGLGSTAMAVEFGTDNKSDTGYTWTYNGSGNGGTLELNNANISDSSSGISFSSGVTGDVAINYSGDNTVSSSNSNGIQYNGNGNITISSKTPGSTLSATGATGATGSYGIYANGSVTIKGGEISVSGNGMYSNGVEINDATVNVEKADNGIWSKNNGKVSITNSIVSIETSDHGIRAGDVDIKDSDVTVTVTGNGTAFNKGSGDITINGRNEDDNGQSYKEALNVKEGVNINKYGKVEVNGEVISKGNEPVKPQDTPVVERAAAPSVETSFLNKIDKIANEGSVKFDLGTTQSITPKMIKAIKKLNNVTFIFTVRYNGQVYRITIPAGSDLDALQKNASGGISVATLIKTFKSKIIG